MSEKNSSEATVCLRWLHPDVLLFIDGVTPLLGGTLSTTNRYTVRGGIKSFAAVQNSVKRKPAWVYWRRDVRDLFSARRFGLLSDREVA